MFLKIFFSLLCFVLINCSETEIKTTSGTVRGQTIDVLNRTIHQFLGIPYAVPPIGSLRFSKPKPIEKPIEGVIDATKPKNSCIQRINKNNEGFLGNLTTNEDCLVLNIWSAKENNSTKLKPVMFWIYGGGLVIGSIFQSQYNGSVLATKDVVLVSSNYRLVLLGFMYAGDESVPGNMGFYDQLLALKWVKENIHLFGGDKNQITIFGESAGSWSVSVHLLSPLSNGLFKRAIMQSGANMFNKDRPRISKDEAINIAKTTAKRFNCTDDKQWLQCLRKVDAKQLSFEDNVSPIEGTEFLPVFTQKAFTNLTFNKDLDLMAGITKDEGSILAPLSYPEMLDKTLTEKDFTQFVERVNPSIHNLNASKISEYYLKYGDKNNSEAIKWKIYDFYGDILIKCPTYLFAKQYAERSSNKTNVFFFELTHTANGTAFEKEFGIPHGADIPFVFGQLLLEPTRHPKENIKFSEEVVKYWTDFAKYGKPGNHWFNMISHRSKPPLTRTKELNPKYPNTVIINLLEYHCNGFWKDFYLD